jgi:hypothetical protein
MVAGMNWAADFLKAQQGLRKAMDLLNDKKWREAMDLLHDVQHAEYRLRDMVSKMLVEADSKAIVDAVHAKRS